MLHGTANRLIKNNKIKKIRRGSKIKILPQCWKKLLMKVCLQSHGLSTPSPEQLRELHRAPWALPSAELCRDTAALTASPGGPEAAGSGFVCGCQTQDRGPLQLHPQPLSVSGHYAGFLARCLRSLSGAREGGTALDRHCAPSSASFPRLHRELLTQELGLALQCCQTNPTRTWQGPFSPPLPPVFRKCLVFSCHSDFNPTFKFY